jgi:flagellar hook-length control protein FliK
MRSAQSLAAAPGDQAAAQALAGPGTAGVQQGFGSQPQSQTQPQLQAKAITEAPKSAGRPGVQRSTAPASYRTVNVATLRAAEAARDSVIKQIALKLGPHGGEMRVRLDPPELGRLDLRMVVEKGAVLQLSIAAERPEVLMMLDKHMPELRNVLSGQGLDLSGAQIETSLARHDHDSGSRSSLGEDTHGTNDEFETTPSLRRGGYVTAEGLDFWV